MINPGRRIATVSSGMRSGACRSDARRDSTKRSTMCGPCSATQPRRPAAVPKAVASLGAGGRGGGPSAPGTTAAIAVSPTSNAAARLGMAVP